MTETEAFLKAMTSLGEKLDTGLERVHDRIDEVGRSQQEIAQQNAVFAERLSNHTTRDDIHHAGEDCSISHEFKKHVDTHSKIVRADIATIVGAAIVSAMLLAGAGYMAALVFGK